jgi:hypothetical protein
MDFDQKILYHLMPGLGVWAAEGIEAKSGPSEDSFAGFAAQ